MFLSIGGDDPIPCRTAAQQRGRSGNHKHERMRMVRENSKVFDKNRWSREREVRRHSLTLKCRGTRLISPAYIRGGCDDSISISSLSN